MRYAAFLIPVITAAPLICAVTPSQVHAADNARITGLTDISFGTVALASDQIRSINLTVCSYRGQPNRLNYSVSAIGSGPGGAFFLQSGASALPYDVRWADAPGVIGGTLLQPGIARPGFGNAATGFTCPQQPTTASLTITLRAADLGAARAGTYSGTLQLTISPE